MQPVRPLLLSVTPVSPVANHQQFLFLCLLLLVVLAGIVLLFWQIWLLGDRVNRIATSLNGSRTRQSKAKTGIKRPSLEKRIPEEPIEDPKEESHTNQTLPQEMPTKFTCSCGRKWKISSPGHYKCKCGKKFTI